MYIFGQDNSANTLDDLQRLVKLEKTKNLRQEEADKTAAVSSELIDYVDRISNVRIQNQSLNCRSFTKLLKAGYFAPLEIKYKLYGRQDRAPQLIQSFAFWQSEMHKLVEDGIIPADEIAKTREAVELCTIVSPAMWDKSCVVAPSNNFKEAALTMKPLDKRTSDYFFSDVEECNYIFTIPSLEGIDVCEEILGQDKAKETEGLIFATIQTPDPETDLTPLINQTSPLLVRFVRNNYATLNNEVYQKEFLTETIACFLSHLNKEPLSESISKEDIGPVISFLLVFRNKQRECGYEYVHAYSIRLPELREKDNDKSVEQKQKEQIANMLCNLVAQSMTQSKSVQSTHIVYRGQGEKNSAAPSNKKARGNKKASSSKTKVLTVQSLLLKPNISIFEERKKAEQSDSDCSEGYKPHVVRAHMHAYWRGPRGRQVLGLPQLVKGFIRDGSKARAARERRESVLASRVEWIKMLHM